MSNHQTRGMCVTSNTHNKCQVQEWPRPDLNWSRQAILNCMSQVLSSATLNARSNKDTLIFFFFVIPSKTRGTCFCTCSKNTVNYTKACILKQNQNSIKNGCRQYIFTTSKCDHENFNFCKSGLLNVNSVYSMDFSAKMWRTETITHPRQVGLQWKHGS